MSPRPACCQLAPELQRWPATHQFRAVAIGAWTSRFSRLRRLGLLGSERTTMIQVPYRWGRACRDSAAAKPASSFSHGNREREKKKVVSVEAFPAGGAEPAGRSTGMHAGNADAEGGAWQLAVVSRHHAPSRSSQDPTPGNAHPRHCPGIAVSAWSLPTEKGHCSCCWTGGSCWTRAGKRFRHTGSLLPQEPVCASP